MKKIYFLLVAVAMTTFSANAQSRKTWDFTKGLCEETLENLAADGSNWTVENNSDGSLRGYKGNSKMSGTLKANGVEIEEFKGLVFGTAGLSSSGNMNIRLNSFRMARANMEVSLPKLAGGQKITVIAKSANSTDSRGVTAASSELIKLEGPDGDVAPGSEGLQTWVWQVDESVGNDSITPKLKILVGGVDFSSIVIDNGDEPEVLATPKVAYLYSPVEGYDLDADFNYVNTAIYEQDVKAINVEEFFAATEFVPADSLKTFDVVVYSESLNDTHAGPLYDLLNQVPVLSFNSALYEAWGQGSTFIPEGSSNVLTITPDYLEHPLFVDMNVDEAGNIALFDDGDVITGKKVMGYNVTEGSDFDDDEVLALVGDHNAIHAQAEKNTYLLLPISSENALVEGEPIITDDYLTLIGNAITWLRGTKGEVRKAAKPTVSYVFENNVTYATLKTSLESARIYYTLDGSVPTKQSTRYAGETLEFTTSGAVINAISIVPAYYNSDMLSDTVVVKSKLAVPTYEVKYEEGVAKVFLTAEEGADIYYNITASSDINKSTLFDSIIVINRPTALTVFAYAEDKLSSDIVEFVVDSQDWTYYNDVIEHVKFESAEGWLSAKGYYTKAFHFYDQTVADTIVTPNVDDPTVNDTTIVHNVPANEFQQWEINEKWLIGTYGQGLYWATDGGGNVGAGYGPATALHAGSSKYALEFMTTKVSTDPASAFMASRVKFQAPFEVTLYMCGQISGPTMEGDYENRVEILTSTDSINWTSQGVLSTYFDKAIDRQSLVCGGTEPVYVKLASANVDNTSKQKTMLFDVILAAASVERPSTGIESLTETAKSVKAVMMFNLAGQQIRQAEQGIVLIRTIYNDGSVATKKVFVK